MFIYRLHPACGVLLYTFTFIPIIGSEIHRQCLRSSNIQDGLPGVQVSIYNESLLSKNPVREPGKYVAVQ